MRTIALLLFALFVVSTTSAQTQTYTLNKPFTCDAASLYPVTSFSEITCRVNNPLPQNYYGIIFPNYIQTDCAGITATYIPPSCQAEVYLWGALPRLYVITSQFTVTNATFVVNQFSVTPGTFTITWQGTDANGNPHNGTLTADWGNVERCGGRECWWHPSLETSTLTVVR